MAPIDAVFIFVSYQLDMQVFLPRRLIFDVLDVFVV